MVYSFMYAYFFQLNEKLKSNDSKFYSGAFVILSIVFQILLIGSFFKVLIGNPIEVTYPKYVYLPFAVLLIWLLERLFRKYGDEMIKKYEKRNLLSVTNAVLIITLMFGPLIVSIFMLKTS